MPEGDADRAYDARYAEGFIDGALEVWEAVSGQSLPTLHCGEPHRGELRKPLLARGWDLHQKRSQVRVKKTPPQTAATTHQKRTG